MMEKRPLGSPGKSGTDWSGPRAANAAGPAPAKTPKAAAWLSHWRRECQTSGGVISEAGGWGKRNLDIPTPGVKTRPADGAQSRAVSQLRISLTLDTMTVGSDTNNVRLSCV